MVTIERPLAMLVIMVLFEMFNYDKIMINGH